MEWNFTTLEHAYQQYDDPSIYTPKIPKGSYECVLGQHQLAGKEPFMTFEITGVEGHTGLLFHPGNTDEDSEGCVLMGEKIMKNSNKWIITNSRTSFEHFMQMMEGIERFTLDVS